MKAYAVINGIEKIGRTEVSNLFHKGPSIWHTLGAL